MKYKDADDLQERMNEIIKVLGLNHVNKDRVKCFRGVGSKARGTIARCHALSKIIQKAMNVDAFYVIEFLNAFDKLSEKEQDRVIIHELMHIPMTFGGGFRHHDFVCEDNVDVLYNRFIKFKGGNNDNLLSWEKN